MESHTVATATLHQNSRRRCCLEEQRDPALDASQLPWLNPSARNTILGNGGTKGRGEKIPKTSCVGIINTISSHTFTVAATIAEKRKTKPPDGAPYPEGYSRYIRAPKPA